MASSSIAAAPSVTFSRRRARRSWSCEPRWMTTSHAVGRAGDDAAVGGEQRQHPAGQAALGARDVHPLRRVARCDGGARGDASRRTACGTGRAADRRPCRSIDPWPTIQPRERPDDSVLRSCRCSATWPRRCRARARLNWDAARQFAQLGATGGAPEANVDPAVRCPSPSSPASPGSTSPTSMGSGDAGARAAGRHPQPVGQRDARRLPPPVHRDGHRARAPPAATSRTRPATR